VIFTKVPKVNSHPIGENCPVRGRFNDHNFLRFLTTFGEQNGVFLKNPGHPVHLILPLQLFQLQTGGVTLFTQRFLVFNQLKKIVAKPVKNFG
jgi:hypothetical protein